MAEEKNGKKHMLSATQCEKLSKIREDPVEKNPYKVKKTSTPNVGVSTAETKEEQDLQYHSTFGITDRACAQTLLSQVTTANPELTATNGIGLANKSCVLLAEIGPRTGLEGMLAVQMVAVHNLAMRMLGRAAHAESKDAAHAAINSATKLNRTFIAQMEALNKHRGNYLQKIVVEHVTVNEGGKAIVGSIQQGNRDEKKK